MSTPSPTHPASMNSSAPCPCDPQRRYASCCQPLHQGQPAPDAETLMRSRYSAYVLQLEPYLLQTWHPDTRPEQLHLSEDAATRWLGLQVKQHRQHDAQHAEVEFVARYKVHGKAERLHELSQFVLAQLESEQARWYYVDGISPQPA